MGGCVMAFKNHIRKNGVIMIHEINGQPIYPFVKFHFHNEAGPQKSLLKSLPQISKRMESMIIHLVLLVFL